jgi:hypothetical protein
MKKIICTAAAFACVSAFAQAPEVMPGPAKGSKDRVLLVGAHQMPLPPPPAELLKMQSMSVMKAEDGFSVVQKAPERVRQFMNELEVVKGHQSSAEEAGAFAEALKSGKKIPIAPMVVKSLGDLKVGFTAAAVRSGNLIGAAPQGTMINGAWTGVERYFHIEGAGFSRVSETDMAATGGMFYMNKAAVNTTVAGKPAISAVFTDDSGQRIEEVLWVDGGKLNKVTFAPNMQNARYGLEKTNVSISAFSLASELR